MTTDTTTETPEVSDLDAAVDPDKAVKPKRQRKAKTESTEPKVKKVRERKDPFDFGDAPTPVKGFKVPEWGDMDKTAIREVLKKSGAFQPGAANFLTAREIKAAIEGNYPITSKGYGEDGTIIKDVPDLLAIAGRRRAAWVERETQATKDRDALRKETLGELADQHRGRGIEARVARMRGLLAGEVWVPLYTVARTAEQRFYDLDGMAGRKSYYEIVPKADLKADGTLKTKNSGRVLKMSPQVFEDLIVGDAEFEVLLETPENFNVKPARDRTPAAPKADGDKPKRQRKAKANEDLLGETDATPVAEDEPSGDIDEVALPDLD